MKNNESLKRDGMIALGAIIVMFLLTFALNWISSSSDISQQHAEMVSAAAEFSANGEEAAATEMLKASDDLPSSFSEAVKRTTNRMLGLVELGNLLAVVAVGGLLGFLVMKWSFPQTLGKIGGDFNDGWNRMESFEHTRWKIGGFLVIFFAIVHGRGDAATTDNLALPISDKAIDTIIYYEVGGKSYYQKRLHRPTVPAWQSTASGVTVGFGVDCGHMSKSQIYTAFNGILSATEVRALQSVAGMKGRNAYYNGLPKVKNSVSVTWDEAMKVFKRNTLPRFTSLTAKAYKLTPTRLHPHENGALLCMTFNRGSGMGRYSSRDRPPSYYYRDRYMEKRKIRYDIARGYSGYVPGHLRAMKRLWSYRTLKGLHLRYNATADLFAYGSKLRLASR